jgi:hypothetical protein
MRYRYHIFVLFVFIAIGAFCQQDAGGANKEFYIRDSIVTHYSHKKNEKDLMRKDSNFYKDSEYAVSKTCSGEWGGTIKFENIHTGKIYVCEAQCAVVVNKINGKYIVTNTLAHLSGFSNVIEIDNPSSLKAFHYREKKDTQRVVFAGFDESISTIGSKTLLDTIGVLTLASFPYNGNLYHIITDFKKTFLATIQNEKYVTTDTISNASIWTYDPEVIRTTDNHYVVFFTNEEANGYLDIIGNKITVIRYK